MRSFKIRKQKWKNYSWWLCPDDFLHLLYQEYIETDLSCQYLSSSSHMDTALLYSLLLDQYIEHGIFLISCI